MAKKDFDFEGFKAKKKNQYLKDHCKAKDVKKSKGGIVMLDYKLAGKKTSCVFIPFKKLNEAQQAFKKIKKDKEHKIKKTAFVGVTVKKGADGQNEVTLEVKKGGISPDLLKSKGKDLFEKAVKMKLNILGAKEEATETAPQTETSATTEGKQDDAKKVANKQKRQAAYDKMKPNLAKMEKAAGKVDNAKLEANLSKYKDALVKLISEAEADGEVDAEEQKAIDELKAGIKSVSDKMAGGDDGSKKKLTPERKAKIKENMTKISSRLDKIVNALSLDV